MLELLPFEFVNLVPVLGIILAIVSIIFLGKFSNINYIKTNMPMPGVRCPKCGEEGKEVWVIPGRACTYCGTHCRH